MIRNRRSSAWGTALLKVALILFLIGPLLWLLNISFQSESELLSKPPHLWPHHPTVDNYVYILTGELPDGFRTGAVGSGGSNEALQTVGGIRNSLIVATATALLSLTVSFMASYAIVRTNMRGAGKFMGGLLLIRLIPPVSLAIPYLTMLDRLNLLDSRIGLILIYLTFTLPFSIWYLVNYLRQIPVSYEEAAMNAGCSQFGAFMRISLRLMLPGILAAATFSFMLAYSEFVFALFLTRSMDSRTAPIVLANLAINYDISYTLLAAATVISVLPTVILGVLLGRYARDGVASLGA
jgi:multiple sugar transport system permease protein